MTTMANSRAKHRVSWLEKLDIHAWWVAGVVVVLILLLG